MSGDIKDKRLALSARESLATSRFKAQCPNFFLFSEGLSGARRCLKR
jgi:hypothetical protein